MLYMVLQLPLGIIYFTLVVTAISTSAYLVISPLLQIVWHVPMFMDAGSFGGGQTYGYFLQWWAMPISVALGFLGFVVTLHASKLVGMLHAAYAKVMLVGRLSEPAEQASAGTTG